jgi:hypothetical protein
LVPERQIWRVTLTKLLFEPTLLRSPLRVVQWWESRRPAYNIIVGGCGVTTLLYVGTLSLLMGGEWPTPLVFAGIAVGIAANLCYTLGWIVEIAVERWLKRPAYGLGPALFRHGLVFSIGLMLLPSVVATVAAIGGWLAR